MTRVDETGLAEADTPTVRGFLGRRRTWIVLGLVLLIGSIVLVAIQGTARPPGVPLGADNPAPAGARAVVQVLGAQGVAVSEAATLDEAIDAARGGATVFLYDELGILTGDRVERLAEASDRLVVAAPGFEALEALAPGVRLAGVATGPLDDAGCEVPAAERAGTLSDGLGLLRVDDEAAADGWSGCFADGDAGVAVAVGPGPGESTISLVGSGTPFSNEFADEAGNAALVLGLLGEVDRLVWYLPGPADLDADTAPTLGELTPGWVTPVLVLGIAVFLSAAVTRGRRFGPLVIEDLPVDVPSGETTEGRARLYARSASRVHALDQLRMGTIARLAALLRLPRTATVDEVATAAAGTTGRDPGAVHRLLVGLEPATDRELVEAAGGLADLEAAVRRALGPTEPSDRPGRRS
ncbi:DUF4350 domain-containing protein [Agromyces sp. MMS24-K17]|uniref:DUF4350 domain-containing protein n=1 Tax=Agromyces sp. MMS24-K17 TaxID=3372850 RepID=UPI003754752D